MFAHLRLIAAGLVAMLFTITPTHAKPPELPGQPIEFKVVPERTQEFFQPERTSADPVEEVFPGVPDEAPYSDSKTLSARAALMFFAGGLSTEIEPNQMRPETLEKWWSIKAFFEIVIPHDPRRDCHEAGRCTRP